MLYDLINHPNIMGARRSCGQFQLPDFCQVVAVCLLHLLRNVFHGNMGWSKFAFYMANSFGMEARAHVSVFELRSILNTFTLEFFPRLIFCHFELKNLIFVLDSTGPFLSTLVFVAVAARFAFAASIFGIISI
jgi:hypothetical protein